jgi:hypothetical protein
VFSLIEFLLVNVLGILTRKVLSVRERNFDIVCLLLTVLYRARKDRSRSAINLCPTFLSFLAVLGTFFKLLFC